MERGGLPTYDQFDEVADDEFAGADGGEDGDQAQPVAGALSFTRRNKSDSYQYRIIEILIDPALLSDFPAEDGFGAQVGSSGYSEGLADLRQQLAREVRRLMRTVLTRRQAQVMSLRLQGRTQVEIGQRLGIHQTTVHKTISGVIDYKNGGACYGGAIKKLRKMCLRDDRVLAILRRMEEVRVEESDI